VLTALHLAVHRLANLAMPKSVEANEVLAQIRGMLEVASESLDHIVDWLQPQMLTYLGIVATVDWYCTKFADRTKIRCRCALPPKEIDAIRATAGGGTYITPQVGQMLNREMQRNRVNLMPEDRSDREFQVFQLIVRGFSTTEIAQDLGLSVKTVSTHRSHVLQKLGLHGTADLARFALKYGLDEHVPR
jgi:DNA-binding NarL/FixJ family response regulator